MKVTWKNGLENSKSQNENENEKMDQQEWISSAFCSQKIRIVVLNKNADFLSARKQKNYSVEGVT